MNFLPVDFDKLDTNAIFSKYGWIMSSERKIHPVNHVGKIIRKPVNLAIIDRPAEIFQMVQRIYSNAALNCVPRSYNTSYNLTKSEIAFESIGGHTNLVCAILDEALNFFYGYSFATSQNFTIDGYPHAVLMEVARSHDLAEARYGDKADNGSTNPEEKFNLEFEYLKWYFSTYPTSLEHEKAQILKLFQEMESQSSQTGQMLYLADKVAALFITLYLDSLKHSPMLTPSSPVASERDKDEMKRCDRSYDGAYKASEMWAVDYFIERKFVDMDETLFFTALIVMMTLVIRGSWYNWRKDCYPKN